MISSKSEPSESTSEVLASLQSAVSSALERKRKLGQYSVVWHENKAVLQGDDAPVENAIKR